MLNKLLILRALFYGPMYLSKPIQALHWEAVGKLNLLSFVYMAMAVVGTLAPLYTVLIAQLGLPSSLIIGYVLYATGLFLCAFPSNAAVAVLTGVNFGLGLSLVGLSLRGLLLDFNAEQQQRVIFWSNQVLNISKGAAVFISGWLVALFDALFNQGYCTTLLISGSLMLTALFFIPYGNTPLTTAADQKQERMLSLLFRQQQGLAVKFSIALFLLGFNQSMLLPLFPLYLKKMAFNTQSIGIILSAGLLAGIALQAFYHLIFKPAQIKNSFNILSLTIAISLGSLFWCISKNQALGCALFMIFFYAGSALSSLLLITIELTLVDKALTFSLFGLAQTALVCGEIAGSFLMPKIYALDLFVYWPLIPAGIELTRGYLLYTCQCNAMHCPEFPRDSIV